jgi:hypothetical protein
MIIASENNQVAAVQLSLLLAAGEESVEVLVALSAFSGELVVCVSLVPDAELLDDLLLYPSAYQPPPFSWKELMDMSFLTVPEQSGQAANGSSVRR